jgi:hypothetical protein
MKILFAIAGAAVTAVVLVATTGAVSSKSPGKVTSAPKALHGKHVSSSAVAKYWKAHKEAAPGQIQTALASFGAKTAGPTSSTARGSAPPGLVDFSALQGSGYPQSGTALGECTNTGSGAQYVLGSANDYAGLFGTDANVNDFSFSADGNSFTKGGRFGNLTFSDSASVPTSGNPSVAATQTATSDVNCVFYVGGTATSDDGTHSGVFVARASAANLTSGGCTTGATCFPTRKLVVQSIDGSGSTLHDAVDLAIGTNGFTHARGVAVADTLFTATGSSIELTLCDGGVAACGTSVVDGEIASSTGNFDQFPSVTFTPQGNVVVAWAYYNYGSGDSQGLDGLAVELRAKTCTPSSATAFACGAMHTIYRDTAPLSDSTNALKDIPFQVTEGPRINQIGTSRIFAVWNSCGDNGSTNDAFGRCDDSQVRYSYSSDGGSTWTAPGTLASGAGDQLQPSKPQIAGTKVVVGYYSTGDALALTGRNIGYDEYLGSAVYSGTPAFASSRVTAAPTWPAADWWQLAEQSIGDTQGVATAGASSSTVWADFTANYDDEPIANDIYAGSIRPASQQDTYLAKRSA